MANHLGTALASIVAASCVAVASSVHSASSVVGVTTPLSCERSVQLQLALDPSAPGSPKQDVRFACFPKRVEVVVTAVFTSEGAADRRPLAQPPKTFVVEESGFSLGLPGICSDTNREVGSL